VVTRAAITNTASETSDQVAAVIQRASTDGTGTSITPKALDGGGAFGGTAVSNLTADTTPGDVLLTDGFNLLNGYLWVPTPDDRIIVAPSGRLVLRLNVAPASATNIAAYIEFAVVG
jgi:hypothetical protein